MLPASAGQAEDELEPYRRRRLARHARRAGGRLD